jgi:DNA-binding CsgD family transcriptional regulator
VTLAVIATGCSILGFSVLYRDRNSRINRLFFINSMLLNAVILFTMLVQFPDESGTVLFIQSIYNIVLIIFLLESLCFILVFAEQGLKTPVAVFLGLLSVVIFLVFIFRGSSLLEVSRSGGVWVYQLRNSFFWFLIYSPFLTVIAIIMLLCLFRFSRRASTNKKKKQAEIMMISILAAYGGGFCFLMIFPALDIYRAPLLTPYFFAIYLYGIFFSISRYRFLSFSIGDVAREVLSHIRDVIVILGPDGTIMDANRNLNEMLSDSRDLFTGLNIHELVESNENFSLALSEISTGSRESFSGIIIYKNRPENRIAESSLSGVRDRFGDLVAILLISREKKEVMFFQRHFKITGREMEVVCLTLSGLTNIEISERLGITKRTVETHQNNIYNKLGVNNKIELLRVASDFNLQSLSLNP